MHEVTMRMSDKAFESLNNFVQYTPDIELVADNQSEDAGDEFKLDVDKLVKTAQRIKRGDVADFKVIDDIDQHLIEVEDEFKLDVDKLVEIAQRIKRGDVADFKKTTPEQLFKEIGI